jgi:hypothetical protein
MQMLAKDTLCFSCILQFHIFELFIVRHWQSFINLQRSSISLISRYLHLRFYVESFHKFSNLHCNIFISTVVCVSTTRSHIEQFPFGIYRQLKYTLTMLHRDQRVFITMNYQQRTCYLLNSNTSFEP